ncbi:MAG: GNAT family N-acetyltransferase, partial [Alphaproteobacteria bacterium]|nr:GNAT family N-acetyltransferase [Alphaproteobacteria bacterium]
AEQGTYYAVFDPVDVPEAIELEDGYEPFLQTLGNHTRRDMRRLRRRAAVAGMSFKFTLAVTTGAAERHALARDTHPEPYLPRHINAYDTFLAAQERGFHALLRSRSGELLSCLAGMISDRTAFVLYQLNQRRYARASLSLTNRSYAIEQLISQGVRELVLPGGGAGLLANAARLRRSGELALIRRSMAPILQSLLVTLLSPRSSISHAVRRLIGQWPPP